MSMRYPGGLIAPTPINQQYPSGVWTGPQSAPYQAGNVWAYDSSFKNTTLLLHGDGATRSFTQDASTNNFQITLNGDTKPNNLTPFITNGYWSNYFDGATATRLTLPSNTAFAFGTGAYTVEAWVYLSSYAATQGSIFDSGNATGALDFFVISTGALGIGEYGVGNILTSSSSAVSLNAWNHVAVVRASTASNDTKLYVNGSLVATGTDTKNWTVTTTPSIGGINISGYSTNGYISNFRVVKGTAVYTAAFTPSTIPLTAITNTSLLTCQSNRFIDNSTNAFTITRNGDTAVSMQQPFTAPSGTSLFGSGYFDGTGDYLTAPNNTAFDFGSGSFTLEAMIFPLTSTPSSSIFGKRASGAVYGPFNLGFGGTLSPQLLVSFDGSNWGINTTSSVACAANAWNHIAVTRNGSTFTIWVNGVSGATASNASALMTNTTAVSIGATAADGTSPFNGYIADARIVKGTAVYTTTFTPPTAPLTPVSGTSLLTLQTNGPENNNGFLDSSLNSFPIARNGNTTQGAFSPYGANWSNYFDGSGDYLTVASSSQFIASGNGFTVEAWVYYTSITDYSFIVASTTGANNYNPYWYIGSSNTGTWRLSWGDATSVDTGIAITLNTWNHVAISMTSGGSGVFYLNGVSRATASGKTLNGSNTGVAIAHGGGTLAGLYLVTGYISNVRYVKNSSVYTSAFTPSTTPLTAVSGTSLLTCADNRFIDDSTNNFTITVNGNTSVQRFSPFPAGLQYGTQPVGGSGYFDGSGDYLIKSGADTLSANFTIEYWMYPTATGDYPTAITTYNAVSGASAIVLTQFLASGTSTFRFTCGPVANEGNIGSYTAQLNTWVHHAIVRSGSTVSSYVNGVLLASATMSSSVNLSTLGIGAYSGALAGSYPFFGYISNLRVVNGTAVYTSAFTPPTAPLTAITNTSLLLSFTNAAIFDNSGMSNLETVGNAQIDTSVVKYGTSSMYFDGSGDWLFAPKTADMVIPASSTFTMECWAYLTAAQNTFRMLVSEANGSSSRYLSINSAGIEAQFGGTSGTAVAANYTFIQNTWYHIALVRNGTTASIYINGQAQSVSNPTQTNAFFDVGTGMYVGRWGGSPSYEWAGYIDDLRITKGVARYVTNFTPPVARMPNQ